MRTEEFNFITVELYDDIQKLPADRYQEFQMSVLMESNIGSDLNAFFRHVDNVATLAKEDEAAAKAEAAAAKQAVAFILGNISPEMNSFVSLIHTINGKRLTEYQLSDDGKKEVIKMLSNSGATVGRIRKIIEAIKKKVDTEFVAFFPHMVNTSRIKQYYGHLKQTTLLTLQNIISESDHIKKQIEQMEIDLLRMLKPKIFHGSKGVEITSIKAFENTCSILNQRGVTRNAKSMSVVAFYQALDLLKEQVTANKN